MIFSQYSRTDNSTRRSTESDFAFLDRCSWKSVQRVRELLDSYLSRYPHSERYEIETRIQSGKAHAFSSSIFELFLHESLVRRGFELTPHPKLEHTGSRPDFLVTCPEGSFYLEAVLASERGGVAPGSQLRIESTLDGLDDEPHPNFLIFVNYRGAPTTQPSAKKLRSAVHEWLNKLDPDRAPPDRDRLDWSHESWKLTIEAVPVKRERRGKTTRLLAGHSGDGGIFDGWTGIRDAIKYKTAKYGDLGKPFLIAVNYDSVFLDEIDERQALYGQEQVSFLIAVPDAEPKLTRKPNGAWYGAKGPTGQRASGAWIFRGLNQYNAARCTQAIYANPWAIYELPCCIRSYPYHSVVDGHFKEDPGLAFGESLGLEANWPGED